MRVSTQQAEKLLQGNLAFSQLGFSMLLTRLKTSYIKDPTPATVHACTADINAFFDKFGMIMGADFATISKL